VPSAAGIKFMQVAAGRDHTCGVSRDGKAYCWGSNGRGQIGKGSVSDSVQAPFQPAPDRRFIAIGAGQDFSCAVERGGAVWCWGDAAYHQLGTADSTFSATPVQVPLPQPALSLGVGGQHACVVTVNRQVICWGADQAGQIGKGVVGLGDTRLREAGPSGAAPPVVRTPPAKTN
jgi:alpha-tubulin suppressor-like RCC1 family protein